MIIENLLAQPKENMKEYLNSLSDSDKTTLLFKCMSEKK